MQELEEYLSRRHDSVLTVEGHGDTIHESVLTVEGYDDTISPHPQGKTCAYIYTGDASKHIAQLLAFNGRHYGTVVFFDCHKMPQAVRHNVDYHFASIEHLKFLNVDITNKCVIIDC